MQIFPEEATKIWTECELRLLVSISLLLQIILIIFGARRRYTESYWVTFLVWLAYLAADSVATIALGSLATEGSWTHEYNLQAFWAPFLLLHLGGPDTITAYSLEDNELWLRHLLGLIFQIAVALYVLLKALSNTALTYIAIPIFVIGIIKYGERTYVLRYSNAQIFKYFLELSEYFGFFYAVTRQGQPRTLVVVDDISGEDQYLIVADYLFDRLKFLFSDQILEAPERGLSRSVLRNKSADEAFKIVVIELAFLYDVLYTKANIIYSRFGIILRFISFFISISAFIVFICFFDVDSYLSIDILVTYLLLVGAVVLEVYAISVLVFSERTNLWLIKQRVSVEKRWFRILTDYFLGFINWSRSLSTTSHKKWWSESIGQYNLINSALGEVQSTGQRVKKLSFIGTLSKKYQYLSWDDVSIDLQHVIYQHLNEKAKLSGYQYNDSASIDFLPHQVLAQRGHEVLEQRCPEFHDKFHWSTNEVEFDHSLLLWHIATDLCYRCDLDGADDDEDKLDPMCRISKKLSDYMLYLLVFCPSMLPRGTSEKRLEETCKAATASFKGGYTMQALLSLESIVGLEYDKVSVLYHGGKLAKQLKQLLDDKKWEIISEVWVEMLSYAANLCSWRDHGQQLRQGGELLTHVCVLMAHLGLSKQYL